MTIADLYSHRSAEAARHLLRVTAGLDSMILGEQQILGQLKDAYRVAQETGSTGPWLNKLFQAAFSAAKRVRSETRVGANAVSMASATNTPKSSCSTTTSRRSRRAK